MASSRGDKAKKNSSDKSGGSKSGKQDVVVGARGKGDWGFELLPTCDTHSKEKKDVKNEASYHKNWCSDPDEWVLPVQACGSEEDRGRTNLAEPLAAQPSPGSSMRMKHVPSLDDEQRREPRNIV